MEKIRNSVYIILFFFSCQTNQEKIYYKFPKGVQDELDSISNYSTIYRIFIATEKKNTDIQIDFIDNEKKQSFKNVYSNRIVLVKEKEIPIYFNKDIEYGSLLNNLNTSEQKKELEIIEESLCRIFINIDENKNSKIVFGTGECFYFNRPWIEKGVQSDFIPPSSK